MTRADHPSGSDRIYEALGTLDPDGRAEIVVNLQGDFPTHLAATTSAPCCRRSPTPRSISRRWPPEIHTEEERTNPNVVKAVGSPIGAAAAARALFHPRHRALRATGRATITSASMPIAAPRWSASWRCRPRRWSSARSSSSCARSRPACGSTSPSSTRVPRGVDTPGRSRNRPPATGQSLSGC